MTKRGPLPLPVVERYGRGQSLIPIAYRQPNPPAKGKKVPHLSEWTLFRTQRADMDQINEWHRAWPDCLWAVITGTPSAMFTLDFDGEVGAATLRRLGLEPHRVTPGGFHVDFTSPDFEVRTITQGQDKAFTEALPGVDVRGQGGFIVVYGSTPFGTYQQVRPYEPAPYELLADGLVAHLRRPAHKTKTETSTEKPMPTTTTTYDAEHLLAKATAKLTSGASRNATGFWLACQARDCGLTEEEAEPLMLDYQAACPTTDATGADALYTAEEAMDSLASAYAQSARIVEDQPDGIVVNDLHTQEADVVDQALHHLAASNAEAPRLFEQGDGLVRVRTDRLANDRVEVLNPDLMRNVLAQNINWYKATGRNDSPMFQAAPVPTHIVRQVLASDRGTLFPALKGVITSPTILPDGTLITTPGYHAPSGLWLDHGGPPSNVPDEPSQADIDDAAALIVKDVLGEFAFQDEASMSNAVAFLLTAVAPDAFTGRPPITIVTANQAGTGKSYLVEVIHTIASGHAAVATPPDREEEFRKQITAKLIAGEILLALDNLATTLSSPVLAQAATAPSWTDRVLGASRTVTVENRLIISVTGNNIAIGGDLARRCALVSLEASQHRPWERTFNNPHLVGWAMTHRASVIDAALTLLRGWHAAGQPDAPRAPVLGSFQGWASTMAGVLHHAGIGGFLANAETIHTSADHESSAWAALLHALAKHFEHQDGWFTMAQFAEQAHDMLQHLGDDAPVLPSKLAYALDQGADNSRLVRLGKTFAAQAGRRFDGTGVRIERHPDPTINSNRYRITKDAA